MHPHQNAEDLERDWKTNPRWKNIQRPYTAQEVIKLRGSIHIDRPLARMGAEKLWNLLEKEPFVRALGALTGNQALQQVQAGLKAIYVSGWQVAADANDAAQVYPDLSLYPLLSVPHLINRINNAFIRADQIQHLENNGNPIDWFIPIVADAEAGFGGPLNAFKLIKAMIEAGAAAIHLEDQLSSLKKCGHMGGKVLVPASIAIQKLVTARFAADLLGIPTLIIARTDAESATMIRSDADAVDQPFLKGQRSSEGYYYLKEGIQYAVARGCAFAPYADLVWCEVSKPDLGEAREFAAGIHEKFPGKWLAYNCSPSFNWQKHLDEHAAREFQEKLAELGYKFQFVTLAGFHTLNASMFELAHQYNKEGMGAYAKFQKHEFEMEKEQGYKAIKHQKFVGAGYFDEILQTLSSGQSSTSSLKNSTEEQQFS
ncbi:isocitrate lyase [Parachlamydia acanthamoebae UV-7]|uniref:Isocitrate lyase n=1 Tax=Parachlamydia acanthamoebae (strain UV7) TaxID=765952 RepID=F8KYZ2_PARAV|nr:isocitrate lyase [Parachlamydia acanthamoebae]CCB86115.1 isocitrate lyase [Parachlamydia acanthamoebae UV-7]